MIRTISTFSITMGLILIWMYMGEMYMIMTGLGVVVGMIRMTLYYQFRE